MRIRVWGSRGSICAPGPKTTRYGGNTTCLEIRMANGQLIIVDAGSGVRNLGKALVEEERKEMSLVFTHSHWDHLMGFPFFAPAYLPGYKITLGGGPTAKDSIKKYLSHQMEPPYFPVDFSLMKARFKVGCQCPANNCGGSLGGRLRPEQCQSVPLNHPNGGFGFKFRDRGKTFVFLTDNELGGQQELGLGPHEYAEFCRGADLLFHDAQYTEAEYKFTKGWGHSTYRQATRLALEAGVKRLGLFHHDPDRTDDELDRQVEICRTEIDRAGVDLECFGVAEDTEFVLS